MCGIAGIFGEVDEALLKRMTRRLAHRGPDGEGTAVIGRTGLGNTRLSLLDFDHGRQPAIAEKGCTALVFNGEIYNHKALRRCLETLGHSFSGHCDTEVLLRAYQAWGSDCCPRLEGMYAFAASDGKGLFLARDPFGIKPLFYALSRDNRRLLFASEVKALLEDPTLPATIDGSSLCDLLVFGFVLGDKTYFSSIRQVPPGKCLTAAVRSDGTIALSQSAHTPLRPLDLPVEEDELIDLFIERLRDSVRGQMVADHPVGAYLSGGVDSALIAALMAAEGRGPVHTFTCADSDTNPDLAASRQVAEALRTRHAEIRPSAADVLDRLPQATLNSEGIASLSLVSSIAPQMRQQVKAALCGEGADELFAGYAIHAVPQRWLERPINRCKYLAQCKEISEDQRSDAGQAVRHLNAPDPEVRRDRLYQFFQQAQLTQGHLHSWDLGSMAYGLEVRVPFLDTRIRDLALALPWNWRIRNGVRKYLVRQAARRILPAQVADQVISRSKMIGPAAAQETYSELKRTSSLLMPNGWREAHPFRQYSLFPSLLMRLDLLIYLFVGNRGRIPEGFRAESLYTTHREELLESIRAAALNETAPAK